MAVNRSTLALTRNLRADIGSEADSADRHLTRQWVAAWDRLTPIWSTAIAGLATTAVTDGAWPNRNKLARSSAMDALQASGTALGRLARETTTTAIAGAERVIEADVDLEPRIIASQAPKPEQEALEAYIREQDEPEDPGVLFQATVAGVVAGRIDASAIAAIFARTEGQVTADTFPLSREAEEAMKLALIKGVTVGDNPEKVARDMLSRVQGAFNGGLTRALTISRTEMLDAYRSASAYIHRANSDLVTAWQWYARLDSKTCFPAGTLVRTSRGEIPIETVNVGDQVITHTGRWQQVYDTTSRAYDGRLVTVEAGQLRVTATADHPFLIEREGRLDWIAAGDIRVGDSILSDRDLSGDQAGHRFGEVAVERRCDQAHHGEPATGEEGVLAGVPVGDPVMPVGLVDFESDVRLGENEVHRAHPSIDGGLLDVGQAELVQSESNVPFGDRLAFVAPVAAHRAEPLATHRGHDAELFSTGQAVVQYRRAPAQFAAMAASASAVEVEPLPASSAVPVLGIGPLAFDRADEVPRGVRSGNREGLPAPSTDLGDRLCRCATGIPAELPQPGGRGEELGSAMLADPLDLRLRSSTTAPVGVGALVGAVAGAGTELRPPSPNPSFGSVEGTTAHLASPLHRIRVTARYDIPAVLRVHNLEVEEDHSYIAEGFAVHNCAACWSRHGRIYPVSEPGPDDHPRGRCTRLPKLATWAELGLTAKEPPSIVPDGQATFNAMSRADQLQVMGPGRLALLDSGQITWDDLATWRNTPTWRRSNQPATVSALQQIAQEESRVS